MLACLVDGSQQVFSPSGKVGVSSPNFSFLNNYDDRSLLFTGLLPVTEFATVSMIKLVKWTPTVSVASNIFFAIKFAFSCAGANHF